MYVNVMYFSCLILSPISQYNTRPILNIYSQMLIKKTLYIFGLFWSEIGKEKGILLSKAWVRHSLITIQNIRLSSFLRFISEQILFQISVFSRSVINRLKNNIVSLEIKVSGLNFFFENASTQKSKIRKMG